MEICSDNSSLLQRSLKSLLKRCFRVPANGEVLMAAAAAGEEDVAGGTRMSAGAVLRWRNRG